MPSCSRRSACICSATALGCLTLSVKTSEKTHPAVRRVGYLSTCARSLATCLGGAALRLLFVEKVGRAVTIGTVDSRIERKDFFVGVFDELGMAIEERVVAAVLVDARPRADKRTRRNSGVIGQLIGCPLPYHHHLRRARDFVDGMYIDEGTIAVVGEGQVGRTGWADTRRATPVEGIVGQDLGASRVERKRADKVTPKAGDSPCPPPRPLPYSTTGRSRSGCF